MEQRPPGGDRPRTCSWMSSVWWGYYSERPDPSDPAQAVSFGTSGHRGSSLTGTFTESHIVAISEAIVRYRSGQGISGPLFLGRDTHALSGPAFRTAVEVLVARGVEVVIDSEEGYTPTPAISHAILTYNARGGARADGIVITPSHNPPEDGGFKYNPPHGGPADTDVTEQIQGAANGLLRAGLAGVGAVGLRRCGQARPAPRLSLLLCRRSGGGGRPAGHRRRGPSARGRSARWREPGLLGGDCGALPTRPRGGQRPDRPHVLVHAARPRRQDPHGLLLARRDGGVDLAQGPLRCCVRQRPRRGPPWHRHPRGRAAQSEPLPRGLYRVPARWRAQRLADERGGGQDDGVEQHHRSSRAGARTAA